MADTPRGSFSSRIGFIAAAAGSAVGLGNIWKFPYETGTYGGAAFLLVYVACAFIICMPIMVAEITMGRHAQLNPHGTFKKLGGGNWGVVGLFGILCGIMILSFYNVVAGWAFGYFLQISFGDLLAHGDFGAYFGKYVANVGDNLFFSLAFMVLTALIVMGGVQKGIERWTKILMPALIIIIVALIIYALTLENAFKGIEFYLVPDFSKINSETVYKALSQAFFSLSLGMGALITYGSYFSKKDNIVSSAAIVTGADLTIAFLAGLLIFPLVFFQGGDVTEGPGLVFVALPTIFVEMGPTVGRIVGGGFFLLLCFAALTSTISLLEVPVAYVTDTFKRKKTDALESDDEPNKASNRVSRKTAVAILALLIFVIGLPSMLSQGAVPWLTNFMSYGGSSHDFMTVIIDVFSDIGLPLGGLLISLFVAYRWRIYQLSKEIESGHPNFKGSLGEKFVTVMLSFVSPVIVGVILIESILQKFFSLTLF